MMCGQTTIGFSVYRDFHCMTTMSLLRMLYVNGFGDRPLHFIMERGCYIHNNRERIVQAAKRHESQFLVFIDSDVVFPPDAPERLIGSGKDIIGGNYNVRDLDPPQSAVRLMTDGRLAAPTEIPKSLFRCATVPGGFMCINLDRLFASKMMPPYFSFDQSYGDDVSFCLRAAAAGLEVWCDPTIKIEHIGERAF